ncbi:Holliday junction resolvase RuvX [[Clostridium] leptum]|nr:Holliday junction resolvase RuvX [[Clostridium] leptum]
MKILAVDLGDTRTGLAVSDDSEFLASPVCIITERNKDVLLEKITDQAKQLGVCALVMGYPRNMDGSAGPRAQLCAQFAERLKESTGLPITLWDERCTTVVATGYLNTTNVRGKKRKAVMDAAAASIILQDYLDYRRNQNR